LSIFCKFFSKLVSYFAFSSIGLRTSGSSSGSFALSSLIKLSAGLVGLASLEAFPSPNPCLFSSTPTAFAGPFPAGFVSLVSTLLVFTAAFD